MLENYLFDPFVLWHINFPGLFNTQTIPVEEQYGHNLTLSQMDMSFATLSQKSSPKIKSLCCIRTHSEAAV